MLFVISGPSYVGKKTAIAHFMKLYSFSSVIPYTTKPNNHRTGETEGIQYHYVDEKLKKDIANKEFVYDEPFNFGSYKEKTLYAYKKSDIQNAIESYSNFIIHASVGNVEKMYNEFSRYHTNPNKNDRTWTQRVYFIFLDFESKLTPDFFRGKQPKSSKKELTLDNQYDCQKETVNSSKIQKNSKKNSRIDSDKFAVNSYDFNRRYNHAQKEINFYEEHKSIFDEKVTSDKTYEICEKLEKVILPKLKVMPTSPDKIPGPLSNMDIIYMCEKRKSNPLEIDIDGRKATLDEIEALLCGSGMHISLSNHIRRIKHNPTSAFIDMAEKADDMEMILDKLYPDETINNGYVMRPNEIILCSSDEFVKLPHDVYAMVVSKFSYTQLGLSIELSPNIIQSGHEGKIHFQIKNNTENYICIYPHIQVAQLLFFRTIQPSTRIYHEDNNHSYDRDNVTPLPRYREKNTVLDAVRRPKGGFIRSVFLKVKDKITVEIVGIIFTFAICILYGDKLSEITQKYIRPLIANLPLTALVVLFALVSCVANNMIYIIGAFVLHMINNINFFIHKKIRKDDLS